MNKIFKALLTLCLAALIASGCAAFYLRCRKASGNFLYLKVKLAFGHQTWDERKTELKLLTGSSHRFPDNTNARWMVRFKIDRKFKPGIYEVGRSDASWNMARQLKTAQPTVTKLTVMGADIFSLRELFTSGDIALSTSSDSLAEAIMNDENYPEDMRSYLPNSRGRV